MRKERVSGNTLIPRLLEGESFRDVYFDDPYDFEDYSYSFKKISDVNACNNYKGDLTVYSDDTVDPCYSSDDGNAVEFTICDPTLIPNDPQEVQPVLFVTVTFNPEVDPDWIDENVTKKAIEIARNEKDVKPLLNKIVDLPGFQKIEFQYEAI